MKRLLKISITILFFLIGITVSSFFLKKYTTYFKFGSFFKDDECGYDAYFLGSSHVLNGIFPMELWEKYGIRSYNMGWHSIPTATCYWQLRLAARLHKPKYAFIDIFLIDQNIKINKYAHQLFDYFPFDGTKNEALKDMFPDFKDRIEYYFPFIYCHNNWAYLNMKSFTQLDPTKGAELRIDVKNSQVFVVKPFEYDAGKESVGLEYSKKIIDFCRSNDIVPVFFCTPYPEQKTLVEWKKALLEILAEENVAYLEFPENIVDFDTDMYDQNSHLNPLGARKVTDCIGKFMVESLGFSSDCGNDESKKWNEDFELYRKFYDSKIVEETKLENVLMLLNDEHYAAEICLDRELTSLEKKLVDQIPHCKLIPVEGSCSVKVYRTLDGKPVCHKAF